jgi:protein-disulfide isomerase
MTSDTPQARLHLPVSERDHRQGPASTPVTLVEYGDYECPYCGEADPIVQAVQLQLGERLRFVFRNFPLTRAHPHAQHAAEAAEAAGTQGRFWEMHDHLYEHQRVLDDDHLLRYAGTLGLDTAAFEQEMAEHRFAARVREDFLSGVHSGVIGTPTFFISDVRHDGSYDLDMLLTTITRAEHHARQGNLP